MSALPMIEGALERRLLRLLADATAAAGAIRDALDEHRYATEPAASARAIRQHVGRAARHANLLECETSALVRALNPEHNPQVPV